MTVGSSQDGAIPRAGDVPRGVEDVDHQGDVDQDGVGFVQPVEVVGRLEFADAGAIRPDLRPRRPVG
jgi:hypothetical protein